MPHGILQRIHPPVVIAVTAALAVAAIAYAFVSTASKPASNYVAPTTGPIVEEVDSPGAVQAANALDLAFQIGGRIANAGPAVGSHVSAGQTLAALSSADAQASLEQTRAALRVQQANLDALQAGTRPEDISVSQTAVTGAQATLAQTKTSLVAAAQDAYVKSDDAIHNRVDQFINNSRSSTPTLAFALSNSQLKTTIESQRVVIEQLLQQWQTYANTLPTDPSAVNADSVAAQTHANLQSIGGYLDLVATGLTQVVYTTSYTPTTVQGYQSSIQVARTNVSTDISALDAAQTSEKNAESALANAQSQLSLKQAGATPQAIAAQQAQVAVAQANVDAALAAMSKTVLSAPIAGTITVNNVHIGETATPNSPLVSMISDTAFQFETYVSQADYAKLKVGDTAGVALDAYQGGAPFSAHVIAIDPAATVQNGVSSYKVTLQFDGNDARISAGLTGNAKIVTKNIANTLSVPTSAIITQGSAHFVLRKSSSGDVQVPVEVGVTSGQGMTQILSGISATDQVRTFGVQK